MKKEDLQSIRKNGLPKWLENCGQKEMKEFYLEAFEDSMNLSKILFSESKLSSPLEQLFEVIECLPFALIEQAHLIISRIFFKHLAAWEDVRSKVTIQHIHRYLIRTKRGVDKNNLIRYIVEVENDSSKQNLIIFLYRCLAIISKEKALELYRNRIGMRSNNLIFINYLGILVDIDPKGCLREISEMSIINIDSDLKLRESCKSIIQRAIKKLVFENLDSLHVLNWIKGLNKNFWQKKITLEIISSDNHFDFIYRDYLIGHEIRRKISEHLAVKHKTYKDVISVKSNYGNKLDLAFPVPDMIHCAFEVLETDQRKKHEFVNASVVIDYLDSIKGVFFKKYLYENFYAVYERDQIVLHVPHKELRRVNLNLPQNYSKDYYAQEIASEEPKDPKEFKNIIKSMKELADLNK